MKLLKIFISIIIFFYSCENNITGYDYPQGRYSYTSYDSSGKQVVQGWLSLSIDDSGKISGIWNLHKTGNPKNIGPQYGKGKLAGELADSVSLWIELNPDFVDNNLLLRGNYSDHLITGKWQWITFSGVTTEGIFKARWIEKHEYN